MSEASSGADGSALTRSGTLMRGLIRLVGSGSVAHGSLRHAPAIAEQVWNWLVDRVPRVTWDGLADEWPGDRADWRALWRRISALPSGIAARLFGRHSPLLRRHNVAIMVVLAAVMLLSITGVSLASSAIAHGAHGWIGASTVAGTPTPTAGVIVVHSAPELLTPTPVQSRYRVGAWVSNSTPGSSGAIYVYVSVRDGITPLAKVPVAVHVVATCAYPGDGVDYGPIATDTDGIAAVPVSFSGLAYGQPVCVTVTASIEHKSYTATTTFTAG